MVQPKYLVAVDNTEEADEVMAAGCKLADATNAELSCITVIRPILQAYGPLELGGYTQELVELEKHAVELATQRLDTLAAEYQIDSAAVHVCRGNPAAEIRALAEKLGTDMIIIGTHARHGLGLLLGSTANAVLHGIGCDALVIKVH
jgi:universal stress protein A